MVNKIKLHEFRDQVKKDVEDFFWWWNKQRRTKETGFPLEMSAGEWNEQYVAYLASKKK